MIEPADQAARVRFQTELDRNFSIVASAGSGKTRAITERIVSIAHSQHAAEWLPALVVVTYTNRAANEMQQRARQQILESRVSPKVIAAFNRAFFGTIHSFCVKVLSAHGHDLGLPPQLDLIEDDEELWNDFVQRQQTIGRNLTAEARAVLLRHVEVRTLMELGRRGGIGLHEADHDGPCPSLDFSALLKFPPRAPSLETIARTQKRLRDWERAFAEGMEFLPLPYSDCRAQKFFAVWRETFGPFRRWLNRVALCAAAEVERDYREFRLTRGAFTYNDQVALAQELFRNPEAAQRIRSKNYRVILDEAQDTAPSQFEVLLQVARPPTAHGIWPNELSDPPRPGHFCMVGDFQQSIFSQHADLQHYRRVHGALVASPMGETLKFSVSFRLNQESVELINATFGELLSGMEGQVEFVELSPRPDVLPGQVVRVDLRPDKNPPANAPERRKAAWEAAELARWIQRSGLRNLRAQSWSEVAILCPRKAWFRPLRDALRREKFAVQIQSETEIKADNPAYAWLTALLTIMVEPHCSYETVGVLREVFGTSDHDLAVFSEGDGRRFDLRRNHARNGVVSTKLDLLAQIRRAIQPLPLFTAVEELTKTVQLRERLRALPEADFENLEAELDRLFAAAAEAEAEGSSLMDFVKQLRANFEAKREPATAEENAIQLITSHKAKGSEWQAVIVPFLARKVSFGNSNFPRLLKAADTDEPMLLLNADDITQEVKDELKRVARQEMERLLYVALTRAKHTLVLACDPDLFLTRKGGVPDESQMKWLRCESGGCNEDTFARLSAEARACEETQTQYAVAREAKQLGSNVSGLGKLKLIPRDVAKKRASDFVRKVNPSGLAEGFEKENSATPQEAEAPSLRAGTLDNEATRYGRWWHILLQQLDWNDDPGNWEKIFRSSLADAPDQKRAASEWNLFRAHTSAAEDFRKQLATEQFNARAEVPFLLKINQAIALEGVIDLALFDRAARRGLIIDWKTNRITRKEIDELGKRYRSQIAAYWKATVEITGMNVQAGLYSTAAGALMIYKSAELEHEWARLQSLPLGRLTAEISAP